MMRIIVIGVMVGLSVISLCPQSYVLVRTDEWVCKWATDSFALQWRHSVEKQLWQDHYQKNKQSLILTHSHIQSFGAGVPSTGASIPAPDGFVGIKHDLNLSEINWIVSARMQGVMIEPTQGYHVEIYRYVDDYTTINIQSKQQLAIKWWWWALFGNLMACDEMFLSDTDKNINERGHYDRHQRADF
ncbi:MAG: DUF1850 domain-containing protein [Moraxella sp.]|nr:DUF1850 domain-containing protein [Moraxella sp.]